MRKSIAVLIGAVLGAALASTIAASDIKTIQ
jgi:hypothetical protein